MVNCITLRKAAQLMKIPPRNCQRENLSACKQWHRKESNPNSWIQAIPGEWSGLHPREEEGLCAVVFHLWHPNFKWVTCGVQLLCFSSSSYYWHGKSSRGWHTCLGPWAHVSAPEAIASITSLGLALSLPPWLSGE